MKSMHQQLTEDTQRNVAIFQRQKHCAHRFDDGSQICFYCGILRQFVGGDNFQRQPQTKRNAMNVRAKMQVTEVTKTDFGAERVKLRAVYGGEKNSEDNNYSKATPSASVEIQIDNEAVHGAFVPGKKYYLDFTPAE